MSQAPHGPDSFAEPLLTQRPWLVALLLGSVATPAAVILAVPAPRPLDAILAWPLVAMDRWVVQAGIGMARDAGQDSTPERLAAVAVGIVLTWVHYVVLARVLVWWVAGREPDAT